MDKHRIDIWHIIGIFIKVHRNSPCCPGAPQLARRPRRPRLGLWPPSVPCCAGPHPRPPRAVDTPQTLDEDMMGAQNVGHIGHIKFMCHGLELQHTSTIIQHPKLNSMNSQYMGSCI